MNRSRAGLFLLELTIVIFFFSIAATLCIQMFVKAHLMDTDTYNTSHASMVVQNIAEAFAATDGNIQETADILGNARISEVTNSFYVLYDEDWNSIEATAALTGNTNPSSGAGSPVRYAALITCDYAHEKVFPSYNGLSPDTETELSDTGINYDSSSYSSENPTSGYMIKADISIYELEFDIPTSAFTDADIADFIRTEGNLITSQDINHYVQYRKGDY